MGYEGTLGKRREGRGEEKGEDLDVFPALEREEEKGTRSWKRKEDEGEGWGRGRIRRRRD